MDSFIIVQDSLVLAERAAREAFMLAPGAVFHLRADTSHWLRFNAAFCCDDPGVQRWFERTSTGDVD
ncbi:MAG: hypothetical protein WB509_26560 [Acetobacteraceae bacterium]